MRLLGPFGLFVTFGPTPATFGMLQLLGGHLPRAGYRPGRLPNAQRMCLRCLVGIASYEQIGTQRSQGIQKPQVMHYSGTRELDALVLAGGKSLRMGTSKARLPLGETTLIEAVVSRLTPMFRRVLVVAREETDLAGLDAPVLTDQSREEGPLVGLARGLSASDASWCFLVGCDMPFLHTEIIDRMAGRLDGCQILAPRLEGHLQPLHAFYSHDCLQEAEALVASGVTSLRALFPKFHVRAMEAEEFLDLDPDILFLRDVDTVEDYTVALELVRARRAHEGVQ